MPREGLVAQMNKTKTVYPGKLTVALIEEVFKEIYHKPRTYTLITGEYGMFMFNWAVTFGDILEVKNYRTSFKRIKGTYFSLFTKHGKYKLRVLGKTFTVYEGTREIQVFENIESPELMNFDVFENPQVHIDKMKIINKYLKELENGRK